jgi:hypothetical protein
MKRMQKTVPTGYLEETMTTLECSASTMTSVIGLGSGTVNTWLKKGQMPAYMTIVCEGLLRRYRARREDTLLAVIRVKAADMPTIAKVINATGGVYHAPAR